MTPGPEPNEAEQVDNLERDQQLGGGGSNAPSHHPSAPPHELFDISTTVDPSYIISLIRKLLPLDGNQNDELQGLAAWEESSQRSQTGQMEGVAFSPVRNGVLSNSNGNLEVMETQHDDLEQCLRSAGDDGEACPEHPKKSAREEAWEESGCVLWDLAANKEHAEFMVQNLALEVLLANLKTSDSVRITEISLGIIGNLACHEDLMNRITFTDGLLETIVDQVFSDDAPCLCEACRLLTSGLQGCQCAVWAKALQSEHTLSRVLWIAENTLNPVLIERAVTLFLAIMENQQEVAPLLLPNLMNLGLPSLLVNLLAFEMGKLTSERTPERYPALDSILRAIEALSVIDDYSQEICSNKELLQMVMELVKIPEKIEFSSSCVTAAVLIANILADSTGLASDMSTDFLFFQSLLDLLPLTSDDLEARSALWSILGRLLLQVQETEMSLLTLNQYVQMLVSRSDLIEDVLLNSEWDTSFHKHETLAASEVKVNSRTTAIKLIVRVLNQWIVAKDMSARQNDEESEERNHADDKDVQNLLDCCLKHAS